LLKKHKCWWPWDFITKIKKTWKYLAESNTLTICAQKCKIRPKSFIVLATGGHDSRKLYNNVQLSVIISPIMPSVAMKSVLVSIIDVSTNCPWMSWFYHLNSKKFDSWNKWEKISVVSKGYSFLLVLLRFLKHHNSWYFRDSDHHDS